MLCQMKNVNVFADAHQVNAIAVVVMTTTNSALVLTSKVLKNHKKSKSMKRAKDRCPVCECDPCDCGWGTCKVVEKR